MTRKLSVSQITTRDWSLEEDVRRYASLGFDGIGVRMEKLDACGVERAIEILSRYQLPVSSLVTVAIRTTSVDLDEVEVLLEEPGVSGEKRQGDYVQMLRDCQQGFSAAWT